MPERAIVEKKTTTEQKGGQKLLVRSTPGEGRRETTTTPGKQTAKQINPEIVTTDTDSTPEIVQTAARPIHAGLAFSLTVAFHNREPTPPAP